MKLTQALSLVAMVGQQALPAFAAAPVAQSSGTVSGFVIPNEVAANQPFTFAASGGAVEGEVISVETVEGEVVATKKPDRFGRVFLASGLAAGSYMLTRSGGSTGPGAKSAPCPIQIFPTPTQPPTNLPGMQVPNVPEFVGVREGLNLKGSGFSGNAADLTVATGKTQVPVMACTANELKTGALPGVKPGEHDFQISNSQTGQSTTCDNVMVYDLQSKLTSQKIGNGQQTSLQFTMTPSTVDADLHAHITSGPVHFSGGAKECDVSVRDGKANVPILADAAGMGRFNVNYETVALFMAGKKGGGAKAGGGPKNPPAKKEKKEPCGAEEHKQVPLGGWEKEDKRVVDDKGKPVTGADGKPKMEYILRRKTRCQWSSQCGLPKGHAGDHKFARVIPCPDAEPYTDANGNGKYDEGEKYTDNNKDGKPTDTDSMDEHKFDSKEERDKYAKDHP